jgi:hypothetical protein
MKFRFLAHDRIHARRLPATRTGRTIASVGSRRVLRRPATLPKATARSAKADGECVAEMSRAPAGADGISVEHEKMESCMRLRRSTFRPIHGDGVVAARRRRQAAASPSDSLELRRRFANAVAVTLSAMSVSSTYNRRRPPTQEGHDEADRMDLGLPTPPQRSWGGE